ncbi:MAG: hypothetical protein WBM04_14180 [Candidatus Korobacteraceae bacterium]
MPDPNHATVRVSTWTILTLLVACSTAEFPAAQTASAAANHRRAQLTQNSVTSANDPNPSSLGAISASVGAAVDRRVNADRQNELIDPSLTPLRITAANVNGEDAASTPAQPETTALSNSSGRPASKGRSPGASPSAGRSPVNQLQERQLSTRVAHTIRHTDSTSSTPVSSFSTRGTLRRSQVQVSSLTGLSKERHQQEIYLRHCHTLAVGNVECTADGWQPGVSITRHNSTQSY